MKTLVLTLMLLSSLAMASDIGDLSGSFEGKLDKGKSVRMVIVPRTGSPGTAIVLLIYSESNVMQVLYGERMNAGSMGLMSYRVLEGGEDFVLDVKPVGSLKIQPSTDNKPNLLVSPFSGSNEFQRMEFRKSSDLQASLQIPQGQFLNNDGTGLTFNRLGELDGLASGHLAKNSAESDFNVRREKTGVSSIRSVAVTTNLISNENPQLQGLVVWFKDSRSEYVSIAKSIRGSSLLDAVNYKKKEGVRLDPDFTKAPVDNSNQFPVGQGIKLDTKSGNIKVVVDAGDLRDGVNPEVDPELFQDLTGWAQHSKLELQTGLRELANIKHSERRKALRTLIDSVIASSNEKSTELYLRSVLRRARLFDKILDQSPPSPERDSVSYRLLKTSVAWAIDLYTPDQRIRDMFKDEIKKIADSPIVNFMQLGVAHTKMILDMVDDIPNHEAKLVDIKSALALLINDLSDAKRRKIAVAPVLMKMVKYYEDIKDKNPGNTLEGLALYRQVNAFIRQSLEDLNTLNKDLNLDFLPPVPGGLSYQSDIKNGVLRIKGSNCDGSGPSCIVYVGELTGNNNSTKGWSEARWWRINGAPVDPDANMEFVSSGYVAESLCAGEICKGMKVSGDSPRGTITGIAIHTFPPYVEIKADTRNGRPVSNHYAVWHTDHLKRRD